MIILIIPIYLVNRSMSYQKSLQLICLRYVTSCPNLLLHTFITSTCIKEQKQTNKILEIANVWIWTSYPTLLPTFFKNVACTKHNVQSRCEIFASIFVRLFKVWNLMLMSRVLCFCPLNLAVGLQEQTLSKTLQKCGVSVPTAYTFIQVFCFVSKPFSS